ncbi:MAG TPA: pitrilysin family protein [Pyrinomonadaceae bacterium]|nr:pitrilysin family protein [Pyrinomonadaceae bacterium]
MIFLALFALAAIAANVIAVDAQNARKVFPYDYKINDLPNGLRVITVPTDYPNLVALYTVVGAGSRNEIEPGKSGYAHFFEHLMFRGSENFPPGSFDRIMKKAGASSNAYTTDDRTVYHATFAKEDLDEIMQLEADRFQRLKYAQPEYKTEALAVLGEYNKNSASPTFKMHEVLRETAYKTHTYSHTTMGYLKDIQDYPNQYEYSLQFFNRFYRPEYTTIVVVGDVKPDEVLAMVNKYYGSWQPGDYKPQIPVEPAQEKARSEHIEWTSPTLPYVAVAYRGPAFSDESKEKAALDLLSLIAFGENSDLFQKLVLQEQKADFISPDFEDKINPELFTVYARAKSDADMNYVRDEIVKTYKRYTGELVPQKQLDQTRSRMRYGFAMAMNSNDAIANTLAPYIALKRTPETLEKLFALYDRITPEDIRAAARTYFQDKNQTVVTLATKNGGKK